MALRLHVLILLGLLNASGLAAPALAQGRAGTFEVGAQAAVLRLDDAGTTSVGLGGRFTLNVSRWAALEAETNFYPEDDILVPSSGLTPDLRIRYSRRRNDGFFGAKIGVRGERAGLFAKARPGFARLSSRGVQCVGPDCALILTAVPEYRTEFAFDLGGVFEVYPSARAVLRMEAGDTVIRHRSIAPPCFGTVCTTHNFSSRVGVGLRF